MRVTRGGLEILEHCHSRPIEWHFQGDKTTEKVLEVGFYWPMIFQDSHRYVKACDSCQRIGNISYQDECYKTLLWNLKHLMSGEMILWESSEF